MIVQYSSNGRREKTLKKWRQEELEARREREKKETLWRGRSGHWRGRSGHGDETCAAVLLHCNLRVHRIYSFLRVYQQTESWKSAVRQLGAIRYHNGLLFLVSFIDPLSLSNLWAADGCFLPVMLFFVHLSCAALRQCGTQEREEREAEEKEEIAC